MSGGRGRGRQRWQRCASICLRDVHNRARVSVHLDVLQLRLFHLWFLRHPRWFRLRLSSLSLRAVCDRFHFDVRALQIQCIQFFFLHCQCVLEVLPVLCAGSLPTRKHDCSDPGALPVVRGEVDPWVGIPHHLVEELLCENIQMTERLGRGEALLDVVADD